MLKKFSKTRKIIAVFSIITLFLFIFGGGCEKEQKNDQCKTQVTEWESCVTQKIPTSVGDTEAEKRAYAEELCGPQSQCGG